MGFLYDSLVSAARLIADGDPELLQIIRTTLAVCGASTFLGSVLGIPLGLVVAFGKFSGKRFVITVLNTLLALPTVVVGLFVYAFLSRRGLLGGLDLLYTPEAIVIGQTILVLPLAAALSLAAVSRIDPRFRQTALTLGAGPVRAAAAVAWEARFALAGAVAAVFGRVIAEVGVAMMLGGNVRGFTRVMTTAMALEYDKGRFSLAVALGMVLLALSFGVNLLMQLAQGKVRA
ncbi:MAG: ABC transporter permease [Deltaproteobacteria bacterium]|nr:ABC transporter permease [Deltaproteobacteria bacterium]